MPNEVKQVGQTYQEYLKEVRAKQFGWVEEEITPIDVGTTVKKSTKRTTKKEVKADE